MKWILLTFIVLGDWLIIKKNRLGFLIWIIGDGGFCIYAICAGNVPEAIAFGIYSLMGILGWRRWKS